jgi:hypothetical protein
MYDASNSSDVHLEFGNLLEDSKPQVGSILTPSVPSIYENIVNPTDLDVKSETTWEVFKIQFILNQKKWVLHHMLFFPWNFFVVNDDRKPDLVLLQTMHYVIYPSIHQTYNFNNNAKRRKGLISYN